MKKYFSNCLIVLAAVFFSGSSVFAQVSAYCFTQSSGTYSAISGTNLFATTWDDNVSSVTIPFTFTFNGTGYTSCNVASNGFITFGATAPATTNYIPISNNAGYDGATSALGFDLINNGVQPQYTTSGITPNRIFIVEWKNARRYAGGAIAGDNFNFQIRLYETTNVVEIMYGTCTVTNTTARDVQVGLRGANNSDYNNRSTTTNWATTTAGGTNTATCRTLNTIVPASGLTFTYTPPPSAPSVTPGSRCGTGTVVLGASGAGAGEDYKWYDLLSGGTLLQTGGASYTTTSIAVTTTYYVTKYNTSTLCESTPRTAVVATINTSPSITAQPTPSTTCAGTNTNFSVTATGGGLTYQWEEYIGSWNALSNDATHSGVTSSTLTIIAPPYSMNGYQYRCVISGTCSPSATSNAATLTVNLCYCTPTYTNACSSNDFINNFSFNTLVNNGTGCNGQANNYRYYTTPTTTVQQGQTYNISMQSGAAYAEGFRVWIDYNQDGDFADAGEDVFNSGSASTSTFNSTVAIPATSGCGVTRMRVRCAYNCVPTTTQYCGATCSTYGETEDYDITICCYPQTPVFYNTPANAALQTTFNNLRWNSTTPIFSLSSTYSSTFNRFQMELNTNETFTGTAYTQTFSGTYNSATKYDLTCNSLSPSLPTTDAVYFCRARASADGGTNWGNWSSGQWYYVFSASPFGWHITSKPQFNSGTLLYNNYGNFLVPNDNGTPTADYIDDWLELQQGSSDNSLTTASDQALTEGSTFYSGGSNNCITVGYYNVTGNQDYHGFRIQSADIPQGATILSSTFTPYAHTGSGCGGSANTTNQMIMRIKGVNQDNCNAWANSTNTATGDPKNRVRTAAFADWNVPSGASQQWSTGLVVTTAPDLTNIVQEIVNRAGYAAGNALGLIVDHNSGVGNYWRYFATMTANVSYSARLQTTFTNFTNDIQYPNVALANYTGATSWNSLIFDVDKSACGACDATFYVYDASGPTLIASGTTSPISLGSSTAANVYVVARLKRNNSPLFKSMTLTVTNGVLPVELLDFSAVCKDKTVQLNWTTASEQNNDYFVVERSFDEMNFQAVAKINGAGNSSTIRSYEFSDPLPNGEGWGGALYYRLKQVDYNGNTAYSKIIAVPCRAIGLDVTAIVPVPSDNYVDVYYNIGKDDELTFTAYDVIGNCVILESEKAKEGGNIHRMDLTALSSGIYHLVVKSSSDIYTNKIVKK